jgi:uncharacterized small protein (DUF1192 family)
MSDEYPETFPRAPSAGQVMLLEIGQLKRELAEARKEIERLKAELFAFAPESIERP